MKRIAAALAVVALLGTTPRGAVAQPLHGFTTVSINGDQGQTFSGASGGILLDLADEWLSVGAEADLFVAWPYFAGRVGPLVQVNVVRHAPVRAFAIAGHSWGEQAGPMIGAGVEFWPRDRVGFRATVQDYLARVPAIDCSRFGIDLQYCKASFHGGQSWVLHRPTVQFGVVWR